MKLGFLTAALPDNTLEQAAKWGAESGFQAIEIACWPFEKAARRYAGVTHIDVTTLDKPKANEIRKMLDGYGLTISSLAYYPNPLHPDADHRETVIGHLKKVIEAAALLEVPVVGTFVGKDKNKTVPQNLEDYAKIWPPIVKFAKEHGVKIAIENCPMIFSYDEWPGGNNLASTPAIWRKMWEIIPDDNFGLNLDPSHLILQMIDYERVVREFAQQDFPRPCQGSAYRPRRSCITTASFRRAWAGRFRDCPAWVTWTGASSLPPSLPPVTITSSASSTKTASSKATKRWSSAASICPVMC